MSTAVMVVVRRNPCDTNHEAFQIGFMDEGFDTEILKDMRFGLSTGDFFKLIGLTPQQAMRLFPTCGTLGNKPPRRIMKSRNGWDSVRWSFLGLLLTEEEFHRLAGLVGLPILRFTYDRKSDKVVHFIARTNPASRESPA